LRERKAELVFGRLPATMKRWPQRTAEGPSWGYIT
jgi:hypothetical protein